MGLLYKSIAFADSPFNPTASGLDDSNFNQNSLVLDINTTGGVVVINLPSVNSMLFQINNSGQGIGGGAMSFYMKGTITAGGNAVTINPAQGDMICGSASASVTGVGVCFHLFVSGINQWGLFSCGQRG